MGQYHQVVNIDKKQYLNPHTMGDGIKLLEFGCSGNATMTGLAILLACSNGRGGGDLHSDNKVIGSWAGDRIAIVGDYWEREEAEASGIPTWGMFDAEYQDVSFDAAYQDISKEVVKALCDDLWIRSDILERAALYFNRQDWSWIFSAEEIAQKRAEVNKKQKHN